MTETIVADAGPLIGLARTELLSILRKLYPTVLIPGRVLGELKVAADLPGSKALAKALEQGWIVLSNLDAAGTVDELMLTVDAGEAEAIALFEQHPCKFLLMDDKHGRSLARSRGLRVSGTGAVLVIAKARGLLPRVAPALDQLADAGYRLAPGLVEQILVKAGEG